MALKRNEILEIGNHIVLYNGFDFEGTTQPHMGIILEKKEPSRLRRKNNYVVVMEDGNDDWMYDWAIVEISSFGGLEKLDDNCVFMYESTNKEQFSSRFRNLTEEEVHELSKKMNRHDEIPF